MSDRRKARKKKVNVPVLLKAGQRMVIEATSQMRFRVKGPRRLRVRIETVVDKRAAADTN